LALFIVQNSTY